MMLLRHYCTIKRQAAVGTNGRKQLSTLASNVRCLILPMSPQTAVENQFTPTKAHDAYFDAAATGAFHVAAMHVPSTSTESAMPISTCGSGTPNMPSAAPMTMTTGNTTGST